MSSIWAWLKSKKRSHTLPKHRPSVSFCSSSLKDVQNFCDETLTVPPSPVTPSLFRRFQISTSFLRSFHRTHSLPTTSNPPLPQLATPSITLPEPEGYQHGIVVYYTSLRVVRKTFSECSAVMSILRGYRVSIDERDVSMDDSFREELQEILGRKPVPLPRVFIGGVYIGGFEEIERLQESGELKGLIERLPLNKVSVCDWCGGLRFVLCEVCDGSHKVHDDNSKDGFRPCAVCNANGLLRCPSCSMMLLRRIN